MYSICKLYVTTNNVPTSNNTPTRSLLSKFRSNHNKHNPITIFNNTKSIQWYITVQRHLLTITEYNQSQPDNNNNMPLYSASFNLYQLNTLQYNTYDQSRSTVQRPMITLQWKSIDRSHVLHAIDIYHTDWVIHDIWCDIFNTYAIDTEQLNGRHILTDTPMDTCQPSRLLSGSDTVSHIPHYIVPIKYYDVLMHCMDWLCRGVVDTQTVDAGLLFTGRYDEIYDILLQQHTLNECNTSQLTHENIMSLILYILMCLPETILTQHSYTRLMNITHVDQPSIQCHKLQSILNELPVLNYTIIQKLILCCRLIIQCHQNSTDDALNTLTTNITPCLQQDIQHTNYNQLDQLFHILINNYEYLFNDTANPDLTQHHTSLCIQQPIHVKKASTPSNSSMPTVVTTGITTVSTNIPGSTSSIHYLSDPRDKHSIITASDPDHRSIDMPMNHLSTTPVAPPPRRFQLQQLTPSDLQSDIYNIINRSTEPQQHNNKQSCNKQQYKQLYKHNAEEKEEYVPSCHTTNKLQLYPVTPANAAH